MDYVELIKDFWRVRSIDSSLTNDDFALYCYLCNLLEAADWATDTIMQRGDLICGLLKIGPRTLEDSRNRLKQKGFLDSFTKTITDKTGKKRGVKGSSITFRILDRHSNRLLSRNQNGVETQSNRSRNDNHVLKDNSNNNKKKIITYSELAKQQLAMLPEQFAEIWQEFTGWFEGQDFKYVTQIEQQMTPQQLDTLLKKHSAARIQEKILAIENAKNKYAKNLSVYLTVNSWLNR